MKPPVTVPLEKLRQEPYASVLCYPKPNEAELEARIAQLRSNGVAAVEFRGNVIVHGVSVPVLGKGFAGIVVIAHLNSGEHTALKILRTDADRPDMLQEAQLLAKANSVGVGPKLLGATNNFLLMQFIDGDLFPAWLKMQTDKAVVRTVLGEVLEQCWRLDQAGLDHGELSKAPKHVIIDHNQKPFILDFEAASTERNLANVTAISNFLFTNTGRVARAVAVVLGQRNKQEIVDALHSYRLCRTRESFSRVAAACLA